MNLIWEENRFWFRAETFCQHSALVYPSQKVLPHQPFCSSPCYTTKSLGK